MSEPSNTAVSSEGINQDCSVSPQTFADAVIKSEQVDQRCFAPPHSTSAGFKCEVCDQTYHLKDRLIKHVSESHDLSINQIKTEKVSSLKNILATPSERDTFHHQSQSEYAQHGRNSHSSERFFQCNMCEKSFKHKSILTAHQRSHSDERHFQCNLCEKSFKHKSRMSRHMISQ
eukprot:710584_1